MTHLTYSTLMNYIGNQISADERAEVEAHLVAGGCRECGSKADRLRIVLDAIVKDRSVAPPAAVLRKAVNIDLKQPVSIAQPFLQMLAKLQFDSRLQLSPMQSRGVAKTRHMLFSTPQLDIDLEITPERGEHNLVGQILDSEQADEPSQAFVSLKSETGEVLQGTETDALGQFTFQQIPSGVYDLTFDLDSQEVFISSLELVND